MTRAQIEMNSISPTALLVREKTTTNVQRLENKHLKIHSYINPLKSYRGVCESESVCTSSSQNV